MKSIFFWPSFRTCLSAIVISPAIVLTATDNFLYITMPLISINLGNLVENQKNKKGT
jgi:hypothetical protein